MYSPFTNASCKPVLFIGSLLWGEEDKDALITYDIHVIQNKNIYMKI